MLFFDLPLRIEMIVTISDTIAESKFISHVSAGMSTSIKGAASVSSAPLRRAKASDASALVAIAALICLRSDVSAAVMTENTSIERAKLLT